jgi:hypothetical protein
MGIDLSDRPELAKLEGKGVKGHYAAVERFEETSAGKTRWTMATSYTPGGSLPDFVTDRFMPFYNLRRESPPDHTVWVYMLSYSILQDVHKFSRLSSEIKGLCNLTSVVFATSSSTYLLYSSSGRGYIPR